MIDDSTKPRRADIFPEELQEEENTGPGCLVWGVMGLFALLMSIAIVIAAGFAGFNSGLGLAKLTATAERNQNVIAQCSNLASDIATAAVLPERIEVVQRRFENLTVDGVLAPCAESFVPQATTLYEQSIATATPTPSPSPTLTPMPETTQAATEIVAPTSSSGYDLTALLSEAQAYIADGNYVEAIRTLDAIVAIDSSFQTQTVNGLLFNSLYQAALDNYRLPDGSLAEAILLTNRAENYGNISDTELNFEREVAALYINAQAYLNVNYPLAIQALSQIVAIAPNYKDASSLLFSQYVAYGDAYALGGEPCNAVPQYEAALLRRNDPNIVAKRDAAQQACTFGTTATPDPNATIDPNAPLVPTTQGIAPVGQGS
jgi:tetratricopeptide (TPR) repeat protein